MSGGGDERHVVLEVRDLAVREQRRRLLRPSSFALEEGQRALLVGPSGSGKSLIVDLLLGFAGPASVGLAVEGSVKLDGRERLGGPPGAPGSGAGAVFQVHRPGLFDDLPLQQDPSPTKTPSRTKDSKPGEPEPLPLFSEEAEPSPADIAAAVTRPTWKPVVPSTGRNSTEVGSSVLVSIVSGFSRTRETVGRESSPMVARAASKESRAPRTMAGQLRRMMSARKERMAGFSISRFMVPI